MADEMSDVWNSKEPFDQRSAWIDLINAAAFYDDRVFWVGSEAVTLNRGEFFASIRYLAARWKWDRTASIASSKCVFHVQELQDSERDSTELCISL